MEGVDWFNLAHNTVQQRTVLNAIMNVRFYKMRGISWVAKQLSAFHKWICLLVFVI